MMTAKMSEKDSREEILKAFRLFDDDETGKISFRNLKRVAKVLFRRRPGRLPFLHASFVRLSSRVFLWCAIRKLSLHSILEEGVRLTMLSLSQGAR